MLKTTSTNLYTLIMMLLAKMSETLEKTLLQFWFNLMSDGLQGSDGNCN